MRNVRCLSIMAVGVLSASWLDGCATARPARNSDAWVSRLEVGHPLVGLTFEVATGRVVAPQQLDRALASADVVLLGEQHDNADHHRLQQQILARLVRSGGHPAVAFEQLDLDRQDAVDAVLASRSGSPADRATAIAEAVAWDKSGWPPFATYRPLFEEAIAAGLPVRAANLSRANLHDLFAPGSRATAKGPSLFALTDAERASMEADIAESHCGYASPQLVASMVEAQRRRDDAMATALGKAFNLATLAPDGAPTRAGAVLICGFGHARRDYGVPRYLAHSRPRLRVVSIAFLEVMPDALTLAGYANALHTAQLPFDYVTFTPRADNEDPCEKYRAGLEKMKQH